MLIFPESNLTYLAVPKTGSTAVEMALRPRAEIVFAKRRKHMNAQRYHSKVAPFLAKTFGIETETVAVMRDPVDQIRSWYKYRQRSEVAGQPRSTGALSFDDFVMAVTADEPPDFANIGSQHNFLTNRKGEVKVDHLFAYDNQPAFLDFLSRRLGVEVALKQKNVSPPIDAPLSDATLTVLKAARAQEFALYAQLTAAGGQLTFH
ncbi:MAG: hypothetical protein WBV71_16280 [Roseobacter sp.]